MVHPVRWNANASLSLKEICSRIGLRVFSKELSSSLAFVFCGSFSAFFVLTELTTLCRPKRRKLRVVEYEKHAWKNFDRDN